MDASQIGIVATSLGLAKDIANTMVGVRDFNLIGEKLAALNNQLLQAQDALLAHNAAMFQLQNEHFEAREQLRKLQEAARERSCYTLVDLGKGHFAYRMDVAPSPGAAGEPVLAHAPHYICQSCYDNGRKVVLQRNYVMGIAGGLECPLCRTAVFD
jgi:hypothetical protein